MEQAKKILIRLGISSMKLEQRKLLIAKLRKIYKTTKIYSSKNKKSKKIKHLANSTNRVLKDEESHLRKVSTDLSKNKELNFRIKKFVEQYEQIKEEKKQRAQKKPKKSKKVIALERKLKQLKRLHDKLKKRKNVDKGALSLANSKIKFLKERLKKLR